MDKTIFVDTNTLLSTHFNVSDYSKVFMSIVTIEELDHLKQSDKMGYQARQAIRNLKSANNIEIIFNSNYSGVTRFLEHGNDNTILSSAYDVCSCNKDCVFITDDYSLYIKAKALGIPCQMFEFNDDKQEYTGYQEYQLTSEEIAELYEHPHDNVYNLHINEYLIARNQSHEVIEIAKWTNDGLVRIKSDGKRGKNNYFETKYFGKFKPRDEYQYCAVDSLINNKVTLLRGKPGSGKTYLALNYAMSQIEKDIYNKLIIVTNALNTKNSAKIGFLPGTRVEKLMQSSVGSMLLGKFGDKCEIDRLIESETITLIPVGDIRGYETPPNSIMYISEAQNLDVELMKLTVQRVGDRNNKLIIDGDYNQQVDLQAFSGENNGMRKLSEIFRNEKCYGEVMLPNIWRSEIAQIADKM